MSQAEELAELRVRWAGRPTTPIPEWSPSMPPWLSATGNLARVFQHWPMLYASGEVVWGRVLQANESLFHPGRGPSVAEIVWSDDPYVVANPGELDAVCERFHALRRAPARGGPLTRLATFAEDEYRPAQITRFPSAFCAGRVIWHTMVVVYSAFLPSNQLRQSWLPIVRDPAYEANTVVVLPRSMWPPSLIRRWESA